MVIFYKIGEMIFMTLNNSVDISNVIYGGTLRLDDNEYIIIEPNNKLNGCISLFNKKTNKFLRHSYNKLIETESSFIPDFFPFDSSFVPMKNGMFFILGCSNDKMRDCYVCKINKNFYVVDRYLDEYKFSITLS